MDKTIYTLAQVREALAHNPDIGFRETEEKSDSLSGELPHEEKGVGLVVAKFNMDIWPKYPTKNIGTLNAIWRTLFPLAVGQTDFFMAGKIMNLPLLEIREFIGLQSIERKIVDTNPSLILYGFNPDDYFISYNAKLKIHITVRMMPSRALMESCSYEKYGNYQVEEYELAQID